MNVDRFSIMAWCAAAVLCLAPTATEAHNLTRSFATWTIPENEAAPIRVIVQAAWTDIYRVRPDLHPTRRTAAGIDGIVAELVRGRYSTLAGGLPCPVGVPVIVDRDAEWLRVGWEVECGRGEPVVADVDAFFAEAPGHLVMLQVAHAESAPSMAALTRSERAWPLSMVGGATAEAPEKRVPFSTWLVSGMLHVIGGLDHVAFLIALLLLGGGVGTALRIVTAFTAAHSLTLGATVLGLVEPHGVAVETWVGLSIVLVASEALWMRIPSARRLVAAGLVLLHGGLLAAASLDYSTVPLDLAAAGAITTAIYLALAHRLPAREARLRTAAAFLFGLVHGFAFAGALLSEGGVPGEPWRVLLGFNLGVEAGQLLILVAWGSAWVAARAMFRSAGVGLADLALGSVSAVLFVAALALTALQGLGLK